MRNAFYILSLLVILVSCTKSDSPVEKEEEPDLPVYQLSDLIGVWDSKTFYMNGCIERLNISYTEAYSLQSCPRSFVKRTDSKYTFDGNKLVITNLMYTINELSATSLSVTVYNVSTGSTESMIYQRTS